MTFAQSDESAHRLTSSARDTLQDQIHDAHDHEPPNMSKIGPQKYTSLTQDGGMHGQRYLELTAPRKLSSDFQNASTQTDAFSNLSLSRTSTEPSFKVHSFGQIASHKPPRIRFGDFAGHLRRERYLDNKRHLLEERKRVLQKTIALSARLYRLGSWIRDGLVEISKHSDAGCFVRVHTHMQNLVDWSYSQWNLELHAYDSIEVSEVSQASLSPPAFLSKLSPTAQSDLLAFVSCLRSDPNFLIQRFKSLLPAQILALSTNPEFSNFSESALHNLQSSKTKKLKAFSKALEDYSSSFERSNPLSFLLHNIYGTAQSLFAPENQLRLSTWSTVCAQLFIDQDRAYQPLWLQLTSAFAAIHEWRLREIIELFLMDVLQKGAFLLDLVDHTARSVSADFDPLNTDQAHEFFENAVLDLFYLLTTCDGGCPIGALQFASAVIGKLPTEDQQSKFRGDFFYTWFLERFLRLVITYPENESMLLKFHISKDARQFILFPIWSRIDAYIGNMYSNNPLHPVHPSFKFYVESLINTLDTAIVENPYTSSQPHAVQSSPECPSITICAAEIVRVLDALSPQATYSASPFDQFVTETTQMTHMFRVQFSRASNRFDRLKQELLPLLEPGSSSSEIHACKEQWVDLSINHAGELQCQAQTEKYMRRTRSDDTRPPDLAQEAALRIYQEYADETTVESRNIYRTEIFHNSSLEKLLQEKVNSARVRANPISRIYWEAALDALNNKYPLSVLVPDDSAVLRDLVRRSEILRSELESDCMRLEDETSVLEDISFKIRTNVTNLVERFDDLKLKLWYAADVVNSAYYDNTKNITSALNNMALSPMKIAPSSTASSFDRRRPRSSQSATSSVFSQPIDDTMGILKAPTEFGGPKKLADKQIENTSKWLQMSSVDNFCKGEERIHRFCMEVYTASRNLVGESLAESPVLWASELFAHERFYYETHGSLGVVSAPASTRPASVMSETHLSTYRPIRPPFRSSDSRSIGSRTNLSFLPPDLASSMGSPGRAYSATTAETMSTFWSPLPSHTRSLTSASVYSRPPSTFNDQNPNRFTNTIQEKKKFLQKARQALVSLLLSDLGCPVWSMGSETDAWLVQTRSNEDINVRLRRRIRFDSLLSQNDSNNGESGRPYPRRRESVSIPMPSAHVGLASESDNNLYQNTDAEQDDYSTGFGNLLTKLSQVVDPVEKLQVVEDLHKLTITQMREKIERDKEGPSSEKTPRPVAARRRNSLGFAYQEHCTKEEQRTTVGHVWSALTPDLAENQIVSQLKLNLMSQRPKTLFRDIQYISSFVPSEMTDKTLAGKAFLHLGLAAFAYKDELCRAMIDIADMLVAKDSVPGSSSVNPPETTVMKAAEYWMIAAREGNAVAQRELAMLYLSHSPSLPILTLPLTVSTDIFKPEMLWQAQDELHSSTQALCLALHWMKLAAENGDRLAQQRLDERKGRISIR